ncbi:beta-catenin-like protein 1, partial [Clonorchis sinensis]
VIAANPNLYPILADHTRSVSLLLGLLSHENTDISLAVIDLLHELLESNGLIEAGPNRVNPLLDLLFNGQLIQLLMQNVARLDESNKDEADGVHKTLGIVENLLDVRPEMNVTMSNQGLFSWLLRRLQRRPVFDRNKLYVSELLSILLQLDEANRRHLGEVDGIDILLQQLAQYKRHDPSSPEEIELMHNMFDCLCSALMLPENKDRFLKGEGIQLMNLMLREKHMSRDSALRVLDYALCVVNSTSATSQPQPDTQDPEGPQKPGSTSSDPLAVVIANCSKFVDVLGLRTIFPLFMHSPRERVAKSKVPTKAREKPKSLGGPTAAEMEEHVINIIGALLRHCPSVQKNRVLAKFVESDHEKVDRLIELHLQYFDRVKATDSRIRAMKEDQPRWVGYTPEEIEDELMLERLGGGLLPLQILDIIILEVCVNGAPTIMDRVLQLLKMRAMSPRAILQVVQGARKSIRMATAFRYSIQRQKIVARDRFWTMCLGTVSLGLVESSLTNAHPYVRVLIVLATGFDEIETVTVVHVLRAAGAHVTLASLSPGKLLVRGAHMLRIKPDVDLLTGPTDPYDAIILPGGEAAVQLMSLSGELGRLLVEYEKYNKYIGAMGVAALALQQHRIAYGALLTADPRVETQLSDFYGFIASDDVVVDKTLVTCTGPGSAMQFALEIVELLFDKEKAERLSKKLLYRLF